jgi:undecaprenyl-diphosphatase
MTNPLLIAKAALLGIVEGLTEFLPISSTGHLILAGRFLSLDSQKAAVFEIVIQSGAVLAIVWYYRSKFTDVLAGLGSDQVSQKFALNIAIAFLPAALLGVVFGSTIKTYLFAPGPVAVAFIVGGIVLLWVERRAHPVVVPNVDGMNWAYALKIGCVQCLALIPGTSRSGATIVGGLLFGLSRPAATEFSFFLAVPTLIGASVYQLYRERSLLASDDLVWFTVGLLTAFVSASLCVRWLLRFVGSHNFSGFAWYRIVVGLLFLAAAWP